MKWRSAWPIFHSLVILPYILKTMSYMYIILRDYESVWPEFDRKINVGHCDLYFMVQWFCLVSWRPFDVWTSLFRIRNQYDPTFALKINVGHCDLYFMVQWFCIILKTVWFMNIILRGYELVWPDIWLQNKCRSLWPIFYGPVILPYILKTIWCMYIILWDYEPVWPEVWPQNKCRHCDLYFMVQWFCLVSWRLFDVWTSLFRIMIQYDPTFDLKINVGHCDYISWSSDFALYFEDCLVYEHHYLGLRFSMTQSLTSE